MCIRDSKITNDSINQTLSRTVITSGLVFLSVLAMVLFGGEVLRGFSLALLIGVAFGTYSSVAIASPIMVWWEPVSYTHLRAHETGSKVVCRLLLEKKN